MTCPLGIKCPCFCCPETDCEHYQSEAPEWVNDPDTLAKEEAFGDTLIKIAEEGKNRKCWRAFPVIDA